MKKYHLLFTSALVLVVAFLSVFFFSLQKESKAVSATDWSAGRIVDDALFYDGNAMTVDEIQQFLNNKVPACDTWGTKLRPNGQSRADYGRSVGVPPPYICLKDYYENPTTHATNFNPSASLPSGSISAAQIIWSASHDFNVSPKALLATLQKEAAENLIGDDWPWLSQYRAAMGYGCPDTAPCDAEYYGFYNQIYNAARQFRRYANFPDEYRYKTLATNFVQYNPVASCSGTNVYIQSQATASLYNYTPYQPNQPALNNLYGEGDGCSAYGNRNFWRIYSDWFGSTLGTLWRTVDNGTLYYVDSGRKYAVPSVGMMGAYGFTARDVRFVSQAQLDAVPNASSPFTTTLGQLVKSESDSDADGGTVYLIDAGRKIPITSMQQLANYNFSSSDISYVAYSTLQRLPTTGALSNFIQDDSMTMIQMENGKKRVFFELSKYSQTNTSGAYTHLSNFSLEKWSYGTPQIDGSYLTIGPDQTIRLYNGNKYLLLISMSTYECWGLGGMRTYRIGNYDAVNGTSQGNLSCLGKDSGNALYLMDSAQKYPLTTTGSTTPSTPADDVFNRIQTKTLPATVRNNSGEISVIENSLRRPLTSMITYNALGIDGNTIVTLSSGAYSSLPIGDVKFAPGNLVLDQNGTVFVINDNATSLALSSATRFNDYGYKWGALIRTSQGQLSGYIPQATLGLYAMNSGNLYLVDSSNRYLISSDQDTTFGVQRSGTLIVTPQVLANTTQQTASKFIMDKQGGTVYMLEAGKKRPVSSWSVLTRESGNSSPSIMRVEKATIDEFSTGSVVY